MGKHTEENVASFRGDYPLLRNDPDRQECSPSIAGIAKPVNDIAPFVMAAVYYRPLTYRL